MDNCATVCRQGRGEGVGASNEGAVLGAFAAGEAGAQSVGRSGKGEEDGASARRGGAGRGGAGEGTSGSGPRARASTTLHSAFRSSRPRQEGGATATEAHRNSTHATIPPARRRCLCARAACAHGLDISGAWHCKKQLVHNFPEQQATLFSTAAGNVPKQMGHSSLRTGGPSKLTKRRKARAIVEASAHPKKETFRRRSAPAPHRTAPLGGLPAAALPPRLAHAASGRSPPHAVRGREHRLELARSNHGCNRGGVPLRLVPAARPWWQRGAVRTSGCHVSHAVACPGPVMAAGHPEAGESVGDGSAGGVPKKQVETRNSWVVGPTVDWGGPSGAPRGLWPPAPGSSQREASSRLRLRAQGTRASPRSRDKAQCHPCGSAHPALQSSRRSKPRVLGRGAAAEGLRPLVQCRPACALATEVSIPAGRGRRPARACMAGGAANLDSRPPTRP